MRKIKGLGQPDVLAPVEDNYLHELQSPISALKSVLHQGTEICEERRLLIENAIRRIEQITARASRSEQVPRPIASPSGALALSFIPRGRASAQILDSLLSPLISEFKLEVSYHLAKYGLFVDVDAARLICGLRDALVRFRRDCGEDPIRVEVLDSGREVELIVGSPPHRLAAFRLAKGEAPGWFPTELNLARNSQLVIVHREPKFHQMWDERASAFALHQFGVQLHHFFDSESFAAWKRRIPKISGAAYLVEESDENFRAGAKLVADLGIASQSILVSRCRDRTLLEERARLARLKVLPKNCFANIPVLIDGGEPYDAILIDDDPLVRMVWKLSAQSQQKVVRTFTRPDEFRRSCAQVRRSVPLYVDSNLGVALRGEEFSRELRAQGFREIYLATGRTPEEVGPVPWIDAVVGKEPPWH